MQKFKLPGRLQPGDKVAIVSPSSGCANLFPIDPQIIVPNGSIVSIDGDKQKIFFE